MLARCECCGEVFRVEAVARKLRPADHPQQLFGVPVSHVVCPALRCEECLEQRGDRYGRGSLYDNAMRRLERN